MSSERNETDGAREQVLAAAFAQAGRVLVVGRGEEAAGLVARNGRFVAAEAGGDGEVLVLGAAPDDLSQGAALARARGAAEVWVLADHEPPAGGEAGLAVPPPLRDRLRVAGLAVAAAERVLWRSPQGPAAGGSRLERLDAETAAVLLRCVRTDDPRAHELLERAIVEAGRRLDLQAQLQLEHARTRGREQERDERLERLEGQVDVNWKAEAERLQAELDALRGTRLLRVADRWWRLRRALKRQPT